MKSPSNSAGALPQHTVVPMASGSLLTKIHKGYQELVKLGLVADTRAAHSRRAGDGLFADFRRAKGRTRFLQAGQARHDCEIARHRHAGRRFLRAQGDARHRRRGRGRDRRRNPRRDQAAGRDGRHFCRDRRRRDRGRGEETHCVAAKFRRILPPSSASPATD